jgi:hypothetical protein
MPPHELGPHEFAECIKRAAAATAIGARAGRECAGDGRVEGGWVPSGGTAIGKRQGAMGEVRGSGRRREEDGRLLQRDVAAEVGGDAEVEEEEGKEELYLRSKWGGR